MKKKLARAGLIILLLVAALFVIGSIISARTGRQLNEAAKLQSLVVVIADELQDHVRKKGSYPSNLAELNLDQNKSFMALARGAPEINVFNYTTDGRTFRLTVKNMEFVPGFTGDAQEGLRPIHPSQKLIATLASKASQLCARAHIHLVPQEIGIGAVQSAAPGVIGGVGGVVRSESIVVENGEKGNMPSTTIYARIRWKSTSNIGERVYALVFYSAQASRCCLLLPRS